MREIIANIGFAVRRILGRWKAIISGNAIELIPHREASKWARSPHFWTIMLLMAFFTLIYYLGQVFPGSFHWLGGFVNEPHDLCRALFLIPIIYAALIFRIRGSLVTSFVFLCVILPRALMYSPYQDALIRATVFVVITIFVSLLVAIMSNRIDREKEHTELLQFLADTMGKQEREKKYLARELHDESLQALVDVAHQIDALSGLEEQEETKRRLKKLRDEVDSVLAGIRQIISGLRPPLLEEMGLESSLNWLANAIAEEQGIEINIEVHGETRRLADVVELNLLRIAQEALQNARKHSQAKKIGLRLAFTGDKVQLTVRDNGVGFSIPAQEKLASQMKFGLIGMAERARLIGGILRVESSPGNGTIIFAEVPIKSAEPDQQIVG